MSAAETTRARVEQAGPHVGRECFAGSGAPMIAAESLRALLRQAIESAPRRPQ